MKKKENRTIKQYNRKGKDGRVHKVRQHDRGVNKRIRDGLVVTGVILTFLISPSLVKQPVAPQPYPEPAATASPAKVDPRPDYFYQAYEKFSYTTSAQEGQISISTEGLSDIQLSQGITRIDYVGPRFKMEGWTKGTLLKAHKPTNAQVATVDTVITDAKGNIIRDHELMGIFSPVKGTP